MPQLDGLKEELIYLRLWLGIIVVAEISLAGWVASAIETASSGLLSLAVVVIIVLAVGVLLMHRKIEHRIEQVRSL